MELSENAIKVLESRYLLKDISGRLREKPEELFARVAKNVARAEIKFGRRREMQRVEKNFLQMMARLEFLPNSPTLMNAGLPKGQLSACFVLPVEDSFEGIFTTLKQMALIQQSGGGTGFNFSKLRPAGDAVSPAGGVASGPVSFMKIFDHTTFHIKQGGKRRGANMGILNIDHPDIIEFIKAKQDGTSLANFNISIGMYDSFMRAMERNGPWYLKHPKTGKRIKNYPARQLWDLIVENAWKTGDPGLIFLDAINRGNTVPLAGAIECTNPCGEVPLLPFESCNLGSINLSKMLKRSNHHKYKVHWQRLQETVRWAVRFLDDVIDVNAYPVPEIKKNTLDNRKIGLGVMGWADMLIKLGIPYDSDRAVDLASSIMQTINREAFSASYRLAKKRGTFPNWKQSIYYPNEPVRNATRTSIAPTGTISIIANTSSSIELLFALAYQRKGILQNETLVEIHLMLETYLARFFPGELPASIEREGDLKNVKGIPDDVRNLFKTALEIPFHRHIQHQLAFQKFSDNAVSKTINMPAHTTQEEIGEAYRMAWQQGAKGITVYRSNSRNSQVLNKGTQNETASCKVCA